MKKDNRSQTGTVRLAEFDNMQPAAADLDELSDRALPAFDRTLPEHGDDREQNE